MMEGGGGRVRPTGKDSGWTTGGEDEGILEKEVVVVIKKKSSRQRNKSPANCAGAQNVDDLFA